MKYKIGISVLMPCYNMGNYIAESIQSVLSQSYQNWELIIIDDGSTDCSVDIINSFKDQRIRLFRLKHNVGNYAARNYGLSKVLGKYIAMLDADDICNSNRLKIQFDYMERYTGVGAIGSNYSLNSETGKEISVVKRSCNYNGFKLRLLVDNYMLQSTLFVRSYLLKKYQITYDEQFKYASDYHFVFQCSKFFRVFNIDVILVSYRINTLGITKTKFKEQQMFAAKIRMEIFNYHFHKILSNKEMDVLDDLTDNYKRGKMSNIQEIETTLNKILEYNKVEKSFPQRKLYDILYDLALKYLSLNISSVQND